MYTISVAGLLSNLEQLYLPRPVVVDLAEEVVRMRLGVAVAEQKRFCGITPEARRAEACQADDTTPVNSIRIALRVNGATCSITNVQFMAVIHLNDCSAK